VSKEARTFGAGIKKHKLDARLFLLLIELCAEKGDGDFGARYRKLQI
jgi:hypothetical protein